MFTPKAAELLAAQFAAARTPPSSCQLLDPGHGDGDGSSRAVRVLSGHGGNFSGNFNGNFNAGGKTPSKTQVPLLDTLRARASKI